MPRWPSPTPRGPARSALPRHRQRFLDSIRERGLVPGSRHHVHLSARRAIALEVGRRYGSPVLLEIDARDMHLAGHLFHQAENGVWLTERVPVRFIREA